MFNLLREYCNLIQDENIKADTFRLLETPEVLEAFRYPSSISGKFHPQDEIGEYGLLLHSLRVCNFVIQLYRCVEDYSDNTLAYDILVASALLHDVPCKNIEGKPNTNHSYSNAEWYYKNSRLNKEIKDKITSCILHHTGRWQAENHSDYSKFPNDLLCWCIHQADCMSSRRNILIDINSIDYIKSNLT